MKNGEFRKDLEKYFEPFRKNIIGINQTFNGPYGEKKIIYADWTASGRLYRPIEERITNHLGGFVANTHTETSYMGKLMTQAYHRAKQEIKAHVNALDSDVLIPTGTGMTGAVLKFQRILGLKIPEKISKYVNFPDDQKPVVFITHMEHHSNQTSWMETTANVVCINADINGEVDLNHLKDLLEQHKNAPLKIASVTGCSNVTGIQTPYYEIAEIIHAAGGYCFVDFACSGPYINIDMHPARAEQKLDAIFLSPHKFLGGPGTPGILVFCKSLYSNTIPDQPGGGTVTWTNPWGGHQYFDDIETREDGGTPGFLQTIKAALCIKLKKEMGVDNMLKREHEILDYIFPRLQAIPNLKVLADKSYNRLGVISFIIEKAHFNLVVKLLNDKFGVQTRGGCSCAGTYGHYLLDVSFELSEEIVNEVNSGNLFVKPGWVRASIHPTMSNNEVETLVTAITQVAKNFESWSQDYNYDKHTNEFIHKDEKMVDESLVTSWFTNTLH